MVAHGNVGSQIQKVEDLWWRMVKKKVEYKKWKNQGGTW